MGFGQNSIDEFCTQLASSSSVPGGGGAAAICCALSAALGSMTGRLRLARSKDDEVIRLVEKGDLLCRKAISLADADGEAFNRLKPYFSFPVEMRGDRFEESLADACRVPLHIMECCCHIIELLERYAVIAPDNCVSDAGVAAALCRGALEGAAFNIYINTKSMSRRSLAERFEREADAWLDEFMPRADDVCFAVMNRIRGGR